MNLYVQIKKGMIHEIPVLICENENIQKKGSIILLHKLLEDKEHEIILASYLVQIGYRVLVPDLLYHGESPSSFRENNKMDFNKLYNELNLSMELIHNLLDYIGNDKVGIIGSSYGGMLALSAGALFENIRFVVALCACADWENLITNRSFENFRLFSINQPVIDIKKVQESIRRYDPIYNVEGFEGKNVLLMNGAMDTTFKFNLVEPFYNKLIKMYSNHGNKNFITWKKYNKTGHKITYEMIQDLLEWLNQFDVDK